MHRYEWQGQHQFLLDERCEIDTALVEPDGLDVGRKPVRLRHRLDEPDARRPSHAHGHRTQATLADEFHVSGRLHRKQWRAVVAALEHDRRIDAPLARGERTHQSIQLCERQSNAMRFARRRQPIDIDRQRPGRRHGARMIGVASERVKITFPKLLFFWNGR